MSRYIDADKLMNYANNMKDKTIDANDIARFPTADVVEVIRCKDCLHFDNETKWTVCTRWSADPYEQASVGKNDFCSHGEREEA